MKVTGTQIEPWMFWHVPKKGKEKKQEEVQKKQAPEEPERTHTLLTYTLP
jgi:hypothetical protein